MDAPGVVVAKLNNPSLFNENTTSSVTGCFMSGQKDFTISFSGKNPLSSISICHAERAFLNSTNLSTYSGFVATFLTS